MKTLRALACAGALLASSGALAQQSASFRLTEHVFNAGGRPAGGQAAGSASFRISLDALGDSIRPGQLASGDFQLGGGFVTVYPPPGEVDQMHFTDDVTLVWTPEPSTGTYNLYRGLLSSVGNSTYGGCEHSQIAATTTIDADPVPLGGGYFYLVTARNLIAEEGTKGYSSALAERANATPCP